MNTENTTPLALEMRNITKRFGTKVTANKNVNLDVRRGEILAILGENGSGKTTLMNMIAGIYRPDEGEILINGEPASINSPKDSFRYGVGMIHQHFKLIDLFTATENIVLGIKDEKNFNLKKAMNDVAEISAKYGFELHPDKKIYTMSVSEKQTVEIIKVLYRGADLLILDEPTAVLTPQEIEKLFVVLRNMKKDGKSIIIITHKLNEVMAISDRVAVLRRGEHIATVETAATNEAELTEMMVGKKITLNIERSEPRNCCDRLIVEHITLTDPTNGRKILKDVSFTARAGEILGIAGIAGSGQRDLLETIAGLHRPDEGNIIYNRPKKGMPVSFYHKTFSQVMELARNGAFRYENGETVDVSGMSRARLRQLVNDRKIIFKEDDVMDLRNHTPREIRELGVRLSFVPEDRLGMGLVGNMDIIDNMMLRTYRKGNSAFLNRQPSRELADEIIKDLEVVTPSAKTPVRRLSGGNVQKILVGREIAATPSVLMAAYPVRGLDINSSYMIYNLLTKQKESGVAVVFVGEDLDVLMGLCDRIMVVCAGAVTGTVDARNVTKEEIGLLMTKTEGGESVG